MKNSDLISREALLRKAQALLSFDGKEVVWVRDDVLLAPTIDPVHAAGACYCKECKWKEKCVHHREQDGGIFGDNDFCSFGERRDSCV